MGMHSVLKEWTLSSNRLDESLDKVLVLLQIERALDGAFPHLYKDRDENKSYIFFEGDEKQIAWVSTVSPGRLPGLTAWQLLSSDDDEGGIEIRIIPAFASDPTELLEEHAAAITVLKGYNADFEYLYVDEKIQEDTEWLTEWEGKERQGLPNAVRMRLESEDDDEPLEVIAVIQAHQHQKIRPVKP